MSLALSETSKTGFFVTRPKYFIKDCFITFFSVSNFSKSSEIRNMFLSLYSTNIWLSGLEFTIANREDPEQTYFDVPCLSMPFWQATSVQNFKTFTVIQSNNIWYCFVWLDA